MNGWINSILHNSFKTQNSRSNSEDESSEKSSDTEREDVTEVPEYEGQVIFKGNFED